MTESDAAAAAEAEIRRLKVRLDRERRARREAEEIAEAGLRSLYDANQELDARILERTAELHEALAAAQEANDAKSAFLGQMSHQINTPLNGLLGMLELLSKELTDSQTETWHASAMRSARRLERLTTRLITYVGLETADLRHGDTYRQVREVLSGVHDRWHGPCLRAGQLLSVEVSAGTDASILAPPELDLLFDEVLSNAVEHAGPGAVRITTQVGVRGDTVIVNVADSGPGIDPLQLEQTHQLRASPNQTNQGDRHVDLGLALVDRIAVGLGGTWKATNDGVASVEVTLPIAESKS